MMILQLDWYFGALLIFIGLLGMTVKKGVFARLIGLEIVSKGAMLAITGSGLFINNTAETQSLVIFLIIFEFVTVVCAAAILADSWKKDAASKKRSGGLGK